MSSSKSKTANSTRNTTTDRRTAADGSAIVVNGRGRVKVVDGGAIKGNVQIADEALDAASGIAEIGANIAGDAFDIVDSMADAQTRFGADALRTSLSFARAASDDSRALVAQVLDQDRQEATQLTDRFIKYFITAAAIVGVAWSLRT